MMKNMENKVGGGDKTSDIKNGQMDTPRVV